MKKKISFVVSIALFSMNLLACGNANSKVNEIIQEQMQEDSEAVTTEGLDAIAIPEIEDVLDDEAAYAEPLEEGIDVDLTRLSSTMVYSEVYNMMYTPSDYIGKTIKMDGAFSLFENTQTGQIYYACIVKDATACCAQGIEFELEGDYVYPDDYPDLGDEITIVGQFETYEEDGNMYCRLQNAKMRRG